MKRLSMLLVFSLAFALMPLAGVFAAQAASGLSVEQTQEGIAYSFSVPGREFVCLQYQNRNEQGMMTLYSAQGLFQGVLPMRYTQSPSNTQVTVLSPAQHHLMSASIAFDVEATQAFVKAQPDAVNKVNDLTLTAGEKEMHWAFTASGHETLMLQFSSVMQKGQLIITAKDNGHFSGSLSLPNLYARDLVTITIKDQKGRVLAKEKERTLFIAPDPGETIKDGPLSGVIVCIDPGHQQAPVESKSIPVMPGSNKSVFSDGKSGMAQGVVTFRKESIAALEISYLTCIELRKLGAEVYMTRWNEETGVTNLNRAGYAEEVGADYFIRVHLNMSARRDADALYVYSPNTSPYAALVVDKQTYKNLAQALLDAMKAETGVRHGVVRLSDKFIGNNWAKMPTFLVETGFMSAPANDVLLSHPVYQQRVALGMAKGVIEMEKVKAASLE